MLLQKAHRLLACAIVLVPALSWADENLTVKGRPLTLREVVSRALQSNPELGAFDFELRAQDGRIVQQGLAPNPSLGVTIENALGTGDLHGFSGAETTLSLAQVLESGARIRRRDAAHAGREVLEADLVIKRLDVAAEAARRFTTVLLMQAKLQITREATQLAEETVEAARLRVRAAKSPAAELARAEALSARARLEEGRGVYELEIARRQLAAMWGDTQIEFVAKGDLLQLPEPASYDALVTGLQRNPSLLRFIAEQRLRDAEVRLAENARHPAWQVSAGVRRLQIGGDFAGVFGLSIPLTLRDRGQGAIAEAQALADKVEADRRVSQLQAGTQLFEWIQELRYARIESDALRSEVLPRVEDALKQTQYAYQRGRYGYLELITAQRELLDVKRALIETSANAHRYAIEIDRLTGALPDEAPAP